MVRILLSAAALTGVMQDLVASPSMITVQAPHNPAPQPNFVPTIPISSRSAHSSGISGSPSTGFFRPLTRRLIIVPQPPSALELARRKGRLRTAGAEYRLDEIKLARGEQFQWEYRGDCLPLPPSGRPGGIFSPIFPPPAALTPALDA